MPDDSLLDSNIIIYAAKPEYAFLQTFIEENSPVVSAVSYVEVLGFHKLSESEKELFTEFFAATEILPISIQIVERATELRQIRNITLGDALIAATALIYNLTLVTNNTADFAWIDGLKLFNPLEESAT